MKGPPPSRHSFAGVHAAAIASGALVGQHVAGKATRDTLFLAHFGLSLLPAAMIGAAFVSAVAVLGISSALRRLGPARVVPAMFALGAALFLAEWWLSLHAERWAAIAVYLHTAIFGSAGLSAFWSLVNERFDPHVAKKVVGRIASGGTLGGVIGGVAVWRASAHLSVPMMLALLAIINVVGLLASWQLAPRAGTASPAPPVTDDAKGGLHAVRTTPYLRDLSILVFSGAVVQALLDWLLSAHASAIYGKGARLLAFFALFNMVVGVVSFAAQTGLVRPFLEWRGLAGTVKSQPVSVAVLSIVALVSPHLWAVVLLRAGEAIARNSLYRSAYELFFTPLPTGKKRATKTLIDVGIDRVGTAIGSVVLLAIIHLGSETATRAVLLGAMGMAAVAWIVAARLHDGYVEALATSLKSGAIALDADDAEDRTTKKTLAETTALLSRDKLLAKIEQFQREKADSDVPGSSLYPRSSAASSADDPRDERHGASAAPEPPPPSLKDVGTLDPAELARHPWIARAVVLTAGDVARTKAALSAPLTLDLVAFAIPLLANDAVVRDAVRALRKIAPKATGQLLDALLDPAQDTRVRRRLPRVLKVCRSERAALGMLMALRDPSFEVRVQVALALAEMQEEGDLALPPARVFEIALEELTNARTTWSMAKPSASAPPPTADDFHRGLTHTFTVLGLVLDREPLSIAYRALRSEDPNLRGTALEYLEVILPPRLRDVLVPLLGNVDPAARTKARGSKELAEELLRSTASLPRPVVR